MDNSGFLQVYFYAFSTDNKAKELYTAYTKLTLLNVGLQALSLKSFQDLSNMGFVFERVLRVDQNIIQVDSHKVVEVVYKSVVDVALEGGWPTGQTEWQYLVLVRPVPSPKRSKFFRIRVHPNPVESLSNINLSENLSLTNPLQDLVDEGKRVLILLYNCVKLLIVYIEPQSTITFPGEQNW